MSNMPRSDSTSQIPNPNLTSNLQRVQKILFYEPEYKNFQRYSLLYILINDIDFLTYVLSTNFTGEFIKQLQNDPKNAMNNPDFRNAIRGTRLEFSLPPIPARDQLYAYNCYNNFYNKNTTDSINAINRDRIIPLQNQIRTLQNQIASSQNQINFLNSKLSTDLTNLNNMRTNNQIPEPSGNILSYCPKPTNAPVFSPIGRTTDMSRNFAPVSSPSSPIGGTTDMSRNFAPVSSPSSPIGGTTDMRPRNFSTRYPISF